MLDPPGLFCFLWLQAHLAVGEIVVLLQYNRCLSEMVRKKQNQHCMCERRKTHTFFKKAMVL